MRIAADKGRHIGTQTRPVAQTPGNRLRDLVDTVGILRSLSGSVVAYFDDHFRNCRRTNVGGVHTGNIRSVRKPKGMVLHVSRKRHVPPPSFLLRMRSVRLPQGTMIGLITGFVISLRLGMGIPRSPVVNMQTYTNGCLTDSFDGDHHYNPANVTWTRT